MKSGLLRALALLALAVGQSAGQSTATPDAHFENETASSKAIGSKEIHPLSLHDIVEGINYIRRRKIDQALYTLTRDEIAYNISKLENAKKKKYALVDADPTIHETLGQETLGQETLGHYHRAPGRDHLLEDNSPDESHRKVSNASTSEPLRFLSFLSSPVSATAVAVGANDLPHQAAWKSLYPQCGGTSQTPINIRTRDVSAQRPLSCFRWTNYHNRHPNPMIQNNGHGFDAWAGWTESTAPTIEGGVLKGTYRLLQIHFHWGYDETDGSEHAVNSVKKPLELHLVHFNTKYPNIAEALKSNDPEALAVVGIFFKTWIKSNNAATVMANSVSAIKERGQRARIQYLPLAELSAVFPYDYYSYSGSLTTPGCQQVVRWLVSTKVLHVKSKHLQSFRTLLDNGKPITENFRDLQPLNGRKIGLYRQC